MDILGYGKTQVFPSGTQTLGVLHQLLCSSCIIMTHQDNGIEKEIVLAFHM